MILRLYLTLIFTMIMSMGLFTYLAVKTKDRKKELQWEFLLNMSSIVLFFLIAFGGLFLLWFF